ncbi:MAG TPA: hypothetical protein PKV71_12250 [Calditrichia bacterium]|nr:hypothetical protein [Calditrichia bacterium]
MAKANNNQLFSKRDLIKLGVESLLIVFSVLLALFLNEYRSDVHLERLEKRALEKIRAELKENLATVEEWIPYHREILTNIEAVLKSDSLRAANFPPGELSYWRLMRKGIVQRLVDNSAWEALKGSEVFSNLDFETSLLLSKTYKLQNLGVEVTLKRILDMLSTREARDRSQLTSTLALLRIAFQELVSQEMFLKKTLEETLQKL